MRTKIQALLKEASQLYSAQLVGVVVSFGVSILVARHLGAEGRGAYGWLMALVTLGIQFTQVGTDTLNRRVAALNPHFAPVLAGNSVVQVLALGTLSALVVVLGGLTQPVGQMYPLALVLAALAVPAMTLLSLWSALAAGLTQIGVVARTEMSQRLGQAGLVGLFLVLGGLSVASLQTALLLAAVGTLGWLGWRLHALLGGQWGLRLELFKLERRLIVSAFGAGLCIQLLQRIDLLMLGVFRPLAESGHYTIAQTLVDAMLMLPGALGFVLLAKLAAEKEHRRPMLLLVLGGVLVGFGLICGVMGLLAPWLVPLLFGPDFVDAVPVFQRLLVAAVLMAGFGICQNALGGFGRARDMLLAPLAGLVVKAGLGWWLIPHGVLAAANASIAAYTVALTVGVAVIWWRTRPHAG